MEWTSEITNSNEFLQQQLAQLQRVRSDIVITIFIVLTMSTFYHSFTFTKFIKRLSFGSFEALKLIDVAQAAATLFKWR